MSVEKVNIEVSPKQGEFLLGSDSGMNICSGAIRSGKTFVTNFKALSILESQCIPYTECLITGKTKEAVHSNVVNDLLRMAETEWGHGVLQLKRQPDRLVYGPKRIDLRIVGANDASAEGKIRGKTIQFWLGDEVTLYPERFFMQAFGRCSAGKRIKLLTCNPEGPSHYIKTQVIDQLEKGELDGNVWYFGLQDNPTLDPEYIKQIKTLFAGIMYDRMILGKWVAAEGMCYDQFTRDNNVIDRLPDVSIREHILGVDWGYENPLALLLIAVDYDGNYYVIDEIYKQHQLIDKSLTAVLDNRGWLSKLIAGRATKPSYAYCDSARPEYIDTFRVLTGITAVQACKEVREGINSVHRRFVGGSLKILSKCTELITELENYRWKDNGKDEPVKENDHGADALRYVIHTRERGRVRMANVK